MFRALLKAMRPKQWSKNVLMFVGIFFDGRVFDFASLWRVTLGFVVFCMVSSATYLANDLADIENDRKHPVKRLRPLASGALSVQAGIVAAVALFAASLVGSYLLSLKFGIVITIYAVTMMAYSLKLKHIVIIDVMIVAAGFVLRVFGGTTVIEVTRFSPWLYVCTTLLSLFVAINKRRNELLLLDDEANAHRSSLQHYTPAFLDNMTSIVTATALTSYSFYTFSAPNLPSNHLMMLTIPFVMYAIFRYLYLIHARNLGGAPEDLFLGDRPLMISLLLWGLTAGIVLYVPILLRL